MVLAAIGKSRLLATKKFKQFEGNKVVKSVLLQVFNFNCLLLGLCEENLKPSSDGPATLCGDLQGFWDMMMLQVDNIDAAFSEIQKCRDSGWKVRNGFGFNLMKSQLFICFFRNQSHQVHNHQRAADLRNDHSHNLKHPR